mmetsp:Transcript_48401/g.122036  ORF Transcript_48401/g.122036 Transcript_48401/m.122036 type:complete len:242 (+) Transcript_48401:1606-2331(+)
MGKTRRRFRPCLPACADSAIPHKCLAWVARASCCADRGGGTKPRRGAGGSSLPLRVADGAVGTDGQWLRGQRRGGTCKAPGRAVLKHPAADLWRPELFFPGEHGQVLGELARCVEQPPRPRALFSGSFTRARSARRASIRGCSDSSTHQGVSPHRPDHYPGLLHKPHFAGGPGGWSGADLAGRSLPQLQRSFPDGRRGACSRLLRRTLGARRLCCRTGSLRAFEAEPELYGAVGVAASRAE